MGKGKDKLSFCVDYFFYAIFIIVDLIKIIVRFFRAICNKHGIIGFCLALLLNFILFSFFTYKYNSVRLIYPADLDPDSIDEMLIEVDDADMPNDSYKIYKNGLYKDIIVQPGHSFGYILYQLYMPHFQVEKVIDLLRKKTNFSNIKPGHKISVNYDCSTEFFVRKDFIIHSKRTEHTTQWQGALPMERNDVCLLRKMRMMLDKENVATIEAKSDSEFEMQVKQLKTITKTRFTKGVIENSLYADAVKNGTPPGIIQAMIQEYSFDVDFQRDIHVGDTFLFVFEEKFDENGEKIQNGRFKYGNLVLGGKSHRVYYFDGDFYNEKAESVKKAFMKTPIDGARISSKFSNGRKHPVLGYTRKHQGVDFAAPTGTPIYAAADGVVTFVGVKGGYGNFVMVKHNTEYGTNYAHMSRFAHGLSVGRRVKQREVIGYVGATGIATGPHLHFEVQKNGVKINPSSQKFASIKKLIGSQRDKFEDYKLSIKKHLAQNDSDD